MTCGSAMEAIFSFALAEEPVDFADALQAITVISMAAVSTRARIFFHVFKSVLSFSSSKMPLPLSMQKGH